MPAFTLTDDRFGGAKIKLSRILLRRILAPVGVKRCNTCRRPLSLAGFNKSSDSPDGVRHECRDCNAKNNAARLGTLALADAPCTDEYNYNLMHQLLGRVFGPAKWHQCGECQGAAEQWSYRGGTGPGDPHHREEMRFDSRRGASRLMGYSTDLTRYRPLCADCHRREDNPPAKAECKRGHPRAPWNRRRGQCYACELAAADAGRARKRGTVTTEAWVQECADRKCAKLKASS